MISPFAPALLVSCCLAAVNGEAAVPIEHGTMLTYRGQFDADKGDPFVARKTFDLTLLVTEPSAAGATVYWVLHEQGRGGWHWSDRVGRVSVDERGRTPADSGPTLLYQREEGNSIVPVDLPLASFMSALSAGQTWEEGRLAYEVKELGRRGERSAWRVEANSPYGRARTMWVEEASPVVLASRQRVTIGRGDQFDLQYDLKERATLPAEELATATNAIDQLLSLRDRLNYQPRTMHIDWDKDQLETLRRELPKISAPKETAAFTRLFAEAVDDTKSQKDRSSAIDALVKNAMGKTFDQLKLVDLTGRPIDWAAMDDKVLILHFWNYQDTPLEEPYGQIGYLDFLHRRLGEQAVAIVGVVVDNRLENGGRVQVTQSAKKLRSFMNLGYPIMLDAGALKQIGDPRVAEAKLPLFVVLDRDRKVLEYHVGLYEVDRDHGLKHLEGVARAAAKE